MEEVDEDSSNLTSVKNIYLSDGLLNHLDFLVSGVFMTIVSAGGLGRQIKQGKLLLCMSPFLVGNCLLLMLLLKQAVHKAFHNLLILLSIYDMVYLVTSLMLFSLPKFLPNSTILVTFLPYYILPVAHIGMIGSMFSTVALSIERYVAVVHPFVKYRRWFKTWYFIVPVVIYSVLYNLPKFFELQIHCEDESLGRKNLSDTLICQNYVLNGTSMRNNVWYVNVYGLWLNTLLNIITPLIGILVMNVMVYIIIPNLYEIYSFFLFGENKHWPNWVYLVTTISHFALAVSCSANFYIYYYKHKHNRSSQEREMTVTTSSVDGGVSETRFDGQKKIKTKAKFLNGQKKFIRRQQTKTLNEGEEYYI